VAIQGLVGKLGTLVVAVLFIMVGGAGAGGAGVPELSVPGVDQRAAASTAAVAAPVGPLP